MTFDEYQERAYSFAKDTAKNSRYLYAGLAGEVGEVCSLYAKAVRDGNEDLHKHLSKELGDVLWFIAGIASHYGMSLHDVAEMNINKLQDRKNRNVIGGSGDER